MNATQTNEIIKLEKETQAEVLPLIADKTVKEARKIIAAAQTGGVEGPPWKSPRRWSRSPREYGQILSPVRRVNKNISRILVEELRYDGPERKKIHQELRALKDNLVQFFDMVGEGE